MTAAHQSWHDSRWFETWLKLAKHVAILVACVWSVSGASYYVATTGSATNVGTINAPLTLAKAIGNTSPAAPGDTIYVRGGTYSGGQTSRLAGTIGSKITVRQYGSERPIIEATGSTVGIDVYGSNTWFYGIEVWNSTTPRGTTRGPGVMIWGPGTVWANSVVHDVGTGIGIWDDATPSEVYGNIVYNCGASVMEHGIYAHGTAAGNTIRDNIVLNSFGFGVHVYAETAGSLANVTVQGNISAGNGAINSSTWQPNYLVGGTIPAGTVSVIQNCGYYPSGYQDNLQLGYLTTENGSATVTSNYFGRGSSTVNHWTNLTLNANEWTGISTFFNYNPTSASGTRTWNNSLYTATFSPFQINGGGLLSFADWKTATGFDAASTFTTGSPSGTRVVVRPNAYETGRGNVAVFNWDGADNVSVDLSSVCQSGLSYTVRDAANYYGTAVKTFAYSGSAVSLPMTNLTVAVPVGGVAPAVTGPTFNAFVIVPNQSKTVLQAPVVRAGKVRKK